MYKFLTRCKSFQQTGFCPYPASKFLPFQENDSGWVQTIVVMNSFRAITLFLKHRLQNPFIFFNLNNHYRKTQKPAF